MSSGPSAPVLALLTPGTGLREGLDRIVSGHTGALIVLGTNDELEALSTGGFSINVPLTATGLRELAKMDGAIVLSNELDRILAAAVHLSPSADLPTAETGTRHRTAERVARQTQLPVVTVSASMSTISVFAGAGRQVLPAPTRFSTGPPRPSRPSPRTASGCSSPSTSSPPARWRATSPCATSPTLPSGSR